MERIIIQEARLLETVTESSYDASTSMNTPVRSEPEEDDFFSFESTQMMSITLETEVPRQLQDPDKTLESLKAYSMVKSIFLKSKSTLPSSAPVKQFFC